MDLLIVPVPLFDKNMAVNSYYFRYQKGNDLLENTRPTSIYDGAMRSPILETLNEVGLDAFTMGKPIFIPINNMMLLSGLEKKCTQPPSQVVFLVDDSVPSDASYIACINKLKETGFRFAIHKIHDLTRYGDIVALCDYIFIDNRLSGQSSQEKLLAGLKMHYGHVKKVLTHIHTQEEFAQRQNHFDFFEGRFYRTPLTAGQKKITPLKVNLIRLLNLVQDENFEFSQVAEIVHRDTALTISLLRMVNSPAVGLSRKVKTIDHAVTLLGQMEVRKWATAAVTRQLGADMPDEVTKLSLVRARYAEALADKFGLKADAQSLFLMGLFSVLDVVLEMPMREALEMVLVSDPIRDALVSGKGPYAPVIEFILDYESAYWPKVSRVLIIKELTPDAIYDSYLTALMWYRELLDESHAIYNDAKAVQ